MIRLAVPVRSPDGLSSKVFEHFGKSDDFAIIDMESDSIKSFGFLNNPSRESQKKAADFLADHGVNIVIAGSIGPCMIKILLDRGVKLFMNAEGTVNDAIEDFKAGKLKEIDSSKYI
jgi:predicted Fe-Mo cluster-binding NifX family protein